MPNRGVEDIALDERCPICGEPVDDVYAVSCIACGKHVHYTGGAAPENDCSRIVSQLNLCGLAFICTQCYEDAMPKDKPPMEPSQA